MDKEPFLELIEEKKDNDSDIDIEKQIYEQQTKVRNPNIPESLKTPETSQKKIIKIKNSSKLVLDNDHDSEIYESIISLNDPKIKRRTKHSTTHNYFNKAKSSTKSFINKIIPHKPYSYRRPFSKKKRKFIYILICLINIFINLDRGAIPAGTTEIKNKNKISNAELGMIGSLLYLGLILGSISGGYFFF